LEKCLAIAIGLLLGLLVYAAGLVAFTDVMPHQPHGALHPHGQSLSDTVNLYADPIVINQSMGGRIDQFDAEINYIIRSGKHVVLDGFCASACTMILAVPNLCATDRALLGFHMAYNMTPWGHTPNAQGTYMMKRRWRPYVSQWLRRVGGLTPDIKTMGPADIYRMVPRCA
jgi:hypothetical protein